MADLVFDASPLSYFARAGRLETLERLTAGHRRVVTRAVLDEIKNGVAKHQALAEILTLPWLERVPVDTLDELRFFAIYAARLGSGERNVGEATTLAWAEVHGAIASVDEAAGRKLAKERNVALRGTVGLVCQGVLDGILTVDQGRVLLEELRSAGAWLPPTSEYDDWARRRAY
jgi:predicted nucleic acid-binding protein